MPSVKSLYIASNISELNKISDDTGKLTKLTPSNILSKTALRLFDEADRLRSTGDEEKSYIFYMRFYKVIDILKHSADYKKHKDYYDSMIGNKKLSVALTYAESLQKSLLKRYNLLNEETEVRRDLEIKDAIAEENNRDKADLKTGVSDIANIKDNSSSKLVENSCVKCRQLYDLMNMDDVMIIIIDVRSEDDYHSSHIKYKTCINVPESIVRPGITAMGVESKLPVESLPIWSQRSRADYVIVLDWSSTSVETKSKLHSLKEAIFKWDINHILKTEPLLLHGGYEDWLVHYPTKTTNANVSPPSKNDPKSEEEHIADLLNFDYPNLDSFLSLPDYLPADDSNVDIAINGHGGNEAFNSFAKPVIDRMAKPRLNDKLPPSDRIDVDADSKSTIAPVAKENGVDVETKHPKVDRNLKPNIVDVADARNLYVKEEALLAESMEIEREKLDKERQFEDLRRRKELEAEEEMRQELQKQQEELLDKLNGLESKSRETEDERCQLKVENENMKQRLEEFLKEAEAAKLREGKLKLEANELLRKKMELETEKLRQQRKRQEKLEKRKKSDGTNGATPKHAVSSNEKLTTNSPERTVAKLKEDPIVSNRGMCRSHSSPNIAKLVVDDEKPDFRKPLPSVDRVGKPAALDKSPERPPVVNRTVKPEIVETVSTRRDLMPIYGNQGSGLTGLKNLGNTCYMNSIIQCLANTPHFCFYFLSGTFRNHLNRRSNKGTKGQLAEEFHVIIRSLWCNKYRSITPKDFKSKAGKYISICSGYEQQDSHEFLTVFMDRLHQDVNTAVVVGTVKPPSLDDLLQSEATENFWKHHRLLNQSVITELFEGLLCSTLECLHCAKKSFSFEEFMCLSLPIPPTNRCNLNDCLQAFFKVERMTGEAKWFCSSCKMHRDAEKKIDICKLPKLFIIHLKRFSYEGMWRRKLQTYVDFPFSNFNITTFIPGPDSRQQYTLFGVSNHYGTLEGGHYTAFCRNSVHNKWYKYDDHEVSELSSNSVKSSAAYILFYTSLDHDIAYTNTFKKHR